MTKNDLIKQLSLRQIECSEKQADELENFMHYVLSWNEKINLTAIKDESDFMEKMIFDSALALTDLDLSNKKVIDVGTGAGFPGVVLYTLSPSVDLTLLDSTDKKIKLLNEYAIKNNLKYKTITSRAEIYAKNNREKYDYVFARAVSSLDILLEICIPLLKINGTFIALKGPGLESELNNCKNAFKKLNCHVQKIISDVLPESGETRNIIYISKDEKTNLKYPRDYKDIKGKPL